MAESFADVMQRAIGAEALEGAGDLGGKADFPLMPLGEAANMGFGQDGTPSKHPGMPEDRPRSLYAITRDTIVTASSVLLDTAPKIRLESGAQPELGSLRLGEMHTCWNLPVRF